MPENPFEEVDQMDADEQPRPARPRRPLRRRAVDFGGRGSEMAQSHVPDGRTLGDFMNHLKNIQPVIPDAVALHVMRKNGLNSDDPRIVRLISLATQKFISDIALDAMQLSQIKGLGVRKTGRPTRFVLTADADGVLPTVLQEYGIQMPSNPPANDR
ncbi:Transcription initiation factor TFIID subunit 10 [Aphelenchoides fujianensis]|nr:Transcription initiation factor TFIID subunit 10 [Aphelenchoides fujianensis]